MQLLELNVNWSGFLSSATDLVWLACLVVCAVASALILAHAAMLASEMREGRVPPRVEFMGYEDAATRYRVGLSGDTPVLRSMRPSMGWVQGFLQRF